MGNVNQQQRMAGWSKWAANSRTTALCSQKSVDHCWLRVWEVMSTMITDESTRYRCRSAKLINPPNRRRSGAVWSPLLASLSGRSVDREPLKCVSVTAYSQQAETGNPQEIGPLRRHRFTIGQKVPIYIGTSAATAIWGWQPCAGRAAAGSRLELPQIWWQPPERLRAASPRRSSPATHQAALPSSVPR
jgi:hypothetical protein